VSNTKTKSFKEYLAKIEDPNYQGGSWDLADNASALEKAKYELCENILAHKQDNKLTIQKLAKKINLSETETEDILHYRTNHFTLDRLMNYASKLFSSSQVAIVIKKKGNVIPVHA
jgi:predicted XRE-type DNA-binding protein